MHDDYVAKFCIASPHQIKNELVVVCFDLTFFNRTQQPFFYKSNKRYRAPVVFFCLLAGCYHIFVGNRHSIFHKKIAVIVVQQSLFLSAEQKHDIFDKQNVSSPQLTHPSLIYSVTMLRLSAYSFIIASFCSWLFKTNSSLSKVSILFFFQPFFVLYFAILVRIKQDVVKVNLKNTTVHCVEVLYTVLYHPQVYKIRKLKLVPERLQNKRNPLLYCLSYQVHFYLNFYNHLKKFYIYKH